MALEGFRGTPFVLVVARRRATRAAEAWADELRAKVGPSEAAVVDVAVARQLPELVRRVGVKRQPVRGGHLALVDWDESVMPELGVEDDGRTHLLLADGHCILRYGIAGKCTPEAVEVVRSALAELSSAG